MLRAHSDPADTAKGQVVARQVGALPAEALLAWMRRSIR
jgi:hypothetical protein